MKIRSLLLSPCGEGLTGFFRVETDRGTVEIPIKEEDAKLILASCDAHFADLAKATSDSLLQRVG